LAPDNVLKVTLAKQEEGPLRSLMKRVVGAVLGWETGHKSKGRLTEKGGILGRSVPREVSGKRDC